MNHFLNEVKLSKSNIIHIDFQYKRKVGPKEYAAINEMYIDEELLGEVEIEPEYTYLDITFDKITKRFSFNHNCKDDVALLYMLADATDAVLKKMGIDTQEK